MFGFNDNYDGNFDDKDEQITKKIQISRNLSKNVLIFETTTWCKENQKFGHG